MLPTTDNTEGGAGTALLACISLPDKSGSRRQRLEASPLLSSKAEGTSTSLRLWYCTASLSSLDRVWHTSVSLSRSCAVMAFSGKSRIRMTTASVSSPMSRQNRSASPAFGPAQAGAAPDQSISIRSGRLADGPAPPMRSMELARVPGDPLWLGTSPGRTSADQHEGSPEVRMAGCGRRQIERSAAGERHRKVEAGHRCVMGSAAARLQRAQVLVQGQARPNM